MRGEPLIDTAPREAFESALASMPFDELMTAVRAGQPVDLRPQVDRDHARMIVQAWAAFAATPGGKAALDALISDTLLRVTFIGADADPIRAYAEGRYREGRKSIVVEILRNIAASRGVDLQALTP